MIYVTRKEHFNAAHRLHNPEKSDSWNQEVFGKCNHPNWHGHNYTLEVTVAGYVHPDTGYVIDLGNLKGIIYNRVISKCDHRNLNLDVDFIKGVIPSTENLARLFFEQMAGDIEQNCPAGGKLYAVKLFETENNIAQFIPELIPQVERATE